MTIASDPFAIIRRHQVFAPVELEKIARDLGIHVYVCDLDEEVSGKLTRDPIIGGTSGFVIEINRRHHRNRQRFTLAHEIAHFVLHRDLIDKGVVDNALYRSAALSDHYEAQANRFAADILMPIHLLQQAHKRTPDVRTLANMFGVSVEAMRIRIESLNLMAGQEQPALPL